MPPQTPPIHVDFVIRSITTSIVTVMVIGAAAYQSVNVGKVNDWLSAAAFGILGFYFGQHASLNGRGATQAVIERVKTTEVPTQD